ncbi:erythromycin esterase-like protein [Larkinella arboricola]|uniref:Erythromycin esterase-like protein n=1 Tax=Larkinella arboricola TaxID=643671 RepID=A0A327WSA1_LARAB|nr:erythromycin esterase family protein [Larkinella arboricola]RAJ94127.1 erythromycin esterase-like protein [Larkinella arboricola]
MKNSKLFCLGWIVGSLATCQEGPSKNRQEEEMLITNLRDHSVTLSGESDLDSLLAQIGDARYVLLGEASHGTSEFYQWRAAITRRLIAEKGFTFVAVEGDWPAAYQVNQYLHGSPGQTREVLRAFMRWPTWMWANEEIAQLVDWMRTYNDQVNTASSSANGKVSFYGLDVYSLWESLDRLINDPQATNPEIRARAQEARQCLAAFEGDEQAYAIATLRGSRCNVALERLLEAVRSANAGTALEQVNREQNALVAVNAERYYYSMVRSDAESWNIRDQHMAATVDQLMALHGPTAKAIIWAHNTHVGDARFTDMAQAGMVNLGQLIRQAHEADGVYIVGFGTYQGEVIAGDYWGAPAERMPVPRALSGSWDELLYRVGPENKIVLLNQMPQEGVSAQERGQRAIGVVYNPSSERGNYVPTVLGKRYDGYVFINQTQALTPLPVQAEARRDNAKAPVGTYALIND